MVRGEGSLVNKQQTVPATLARGLTALGCTLGWLCSQIKQTYCFDFVNDSICSTRIMSGPFLCSQVKVKQSRAAPEQHTGK